MRYILLICAFSLASFVAACDQGEDVDQSEDAVTQPTTEPPMEPESPMDAAPAEEPPADEAPMDEPAMEEPSMNEAPPDEEPMIEEDTIEEDTTIDEDGNVEEDEVIVVCFQREQCRSESRHLLPARRRVHL